MFFRVIVLEVESLEELREVLVMGIVKGNRIIHGDFTK